MRIVHAIRSDGFAGVERHVARLARAQRAHGDQVAIIGGSPTAMRQALARTGVRMRPAVSTADVVRQVQALAPGADIVHVHMTAAEIAAGLARPAGGPAVVNTRHFAGTRGTSSRLAFLVAALAAARVRQQIAISRFVADHVEGSSTVVYPGVDSRPVVPRAAERDATILLVQRLEPEKSTGTGLRIFAASRLAASGWRLLVVGDGSQRHALHQLTSDLGLSGSVEFLGVRHDVEALMARAGLLIAPCAIEGLGLSVLEAMAAGLPVVAAAAGGHWETVGTVDTGSLYLAEDADAGAGVLSQYARSPRLRDDLAQAAVAVQRARFTPRQQARDTAAVYAQALA